MVKTGCVVIIAAVMAACSGDDGGGGRGGADGGAADAPKVFMDAPASTNKVVTVTCPATPDATITTMDGVFAYSPASATINVNGIVKFVMSATHTVRPNATDSDPGVTVDAGATTCLKFTAAATYGFHCVPHGFLGSVVVQ